MCISVKRNVAMDLQFAVYFVIVLCMNSCSCLNLEISGREFILKCSESLRAANWTAIQMANKSYPVLCDLLKHTCSSVVESNIYFMATLAIGGATAGVCFSLCVIKIKTACNKSAERNKQRPDFTAHFSDDNVYESVGSLNVTSPRETCHFISEQISSEYSPYYSNLPSSREIPTVTTSSSRRYTHSQVNTNEDATSEVFLNPGVDYSRTLKYSQKSLTTFNLGTSRELNDDIDENISLKSSGHDNCVSNRFHPKNVYDKTDQNQAYIIPCTPSMSVASVTSSLMLDGSVTDMSLCTLESKGQGIE